MDLLKVEHLAKTYPKFKLQDINFSLPEGQIMGLIGKNGAGKSTILKSMLNLVNTDSGTVYFFGQNIKENELEIKKQIGVVLGGVDFYQQKKISTLAKVTSRFYDNWDQVAFEHFLKEFEIDLTKTPKELSAGMKVKLMIALALSHDAKLFIFDEPTSGLDPVSRDDLLNLFKELVATGKRSILFSTHITSDIEKCADSISYIKNGELLESADKETFMDSFAYLKEPTDQKPLTLEEIMVRVEGEHHYDI